MRLVEKYNRQLLLLLIGLLIPLIIGLVFTIDFISKSEIQEDLRRNIERVALEIHEKGTTHSLYPIYEIKEVSLPIAETIYTEVELYDKIEMEMEVFYQLHEVRLINGKQYELIARASKLEKEDLLLGVILSIVVFSLLLMLFLYYFSTNLTSKLWAPFNQYLHQLKSYSIQNQQPIHKVTGEIDEFNELGGILNKMTKKLSSDFQNLKQFTENASHEIQTPLSIIRTKIEELLGGSKLDNTQAEKLSIIYDATNRLSKLNQSLLILSKIENRQYHDEVKIELGDFVQEQLGFLIRSDILNKGDVKITQNQPCNVLMSKTLAEVLLNNLIKNMLTHSTSTFPIGEIEINASTIKFINTGQSSIKTPDKLFNRFYKESSSSASMGLGLAIVHAICQYYKYQVGYRFENGRHVFEVNML